MRVSPRTLNYANLSRVPYEHGVYVFWKGKLCIYVGKAEKMTLYERLRSHYNDSHNPWLKLWINSSYSLEFDYETVIDPLAIRAKEVRRIRELGPLTNVTKK